MTETVSVITLQGKDELSKVLAENNKQFQTFGKTTQQTEKQLNVFNKSLTATKEGFISIGENSKQAVDNLKGLNYGFKSSYKDSVYFGQNLIKTSDTVTDLTSGFKGLALSLTGTKDKFSLLGDAIGGPANELRVIAESRDDTERFFNVLTRVSKPVSKGFEYLGDKASYVKQNIGQLEQGTVSLSKTMSNVGAKSLTLFANTFDSLADSIKQRGGLFSGAIANTFAGVSDAAKDATTNIDKFNKSLNVKDLNTVDKAGISLARTFGGLEERFKGLASGVEAADFVGNMYLSLRAAQDFIQEGLIPTAIAAKDVAQGAGQAGAAIATAAGPMSTIGTIAGVIKEAFKGLKRSVLEVASQFDDIATAATVLTLIVNGAKNARIAMADLNTAMGTMQSLGIPTYAMEMADSIGMVGENLLFSTQAAKEFGQAAITAFAQFQDAASFVTTLTSGEAFRFEDSAAGIESIGAAMNKLVSGPLDNMITSVEASNALYNALSAGVGITASNVDELGRSVANTNELLKFMEAGLKLSSATGTDAASSMEVLSKLTEVYNLSNLQASETAAKLNAVVEYGVTTFPQLVGGLSRTASVAASAGVSIDELFGSVSALTRVMNPQDVLTGYTSLISAIAGQGAQSQKAVKELGIQFDIQSVKADGLLVSLQKLNDATNGNITKLKEIIPDQLAFQTAQNLMNVSMEDAVEIMGKVSDANEGSLDQIFSNRSQSMIRRMTALANGFNETLIEFGQKALPMVEPGLVFMENLLDTINSLPDPIKNMIGMLILFHTGLSRVVDTTLSLLGSFVQITATLVFFRLISSAMKSLGNLTSNTVEKRGGLRDFIGIFKFLLFEEKNIIGAYAHITGINRKFQQQMIETTKALRTFESVQQKTAKVMKNDPSYKIARGDIESYISTLKRLKEERQKVEKRAKDAPELGLETRVKELKALEGDYRKLIAQEKLSRKELFEEGNRAVKKAMRDAGQDITQMRKSLVKSMAQSFSSFDDQTVEQMLRFSARVSKILERTDLDTETKLAAIRQDFRDVLKGVPEENRKSTEMIVNQFIAHMNEMENLPSKFKQKVLRSYTDLMQSLPMEARKGFSEADKIGLEFISDLTRPIAERKDEVKKLVNRLVANLPSEISKNSEEVQRAFSDLITPDPTNLSWREKQFEKEIEKLIRKLGDTATDEVQDEVIQLQKALLEFSRVFNEPPKADKAIWARIFMEQGKKALNTVDLVFTELTAEFDEFTTSVNSEAKANGGSVKNYFDSLKKAMSTAATGTKEEIEAELKKVEEAYQNIDIEDESVKAKLKRYYETLSESIKEADLITRLNAQKDKIRASTEGIRVHLESIGSPEVRSKILANFSVIESAIKKGVNNLSNLTQEDLQKLKQDTETALREYGEKLNPNEQMKLKEYLALLVQELEEGFNQAKSAAKQGITEYTTELERVNRALDILDKEASSFGDFEVIDDDVLQSLALRLKKAVKEIEETSPEIKQNVEKVNLLIGSISDAETQRELAENLTQAKIDLDKGLTEIENTVEPERRASKIQELADKFNQKLKDLLNTENIGGKTLTKLDDILNKILSKEDAEKVINEYANTVNGELTKIADPELRKRLEENLLKAQQTFERRLEKIEQSVKPEERTQAVQQLVANFNHELRKIAADGNIEQDLEQSLNKVKTVVEKKLEQITNSVDTAVQRKSGRMGDIGESLLYSVSSLAGVDIGRLGDIIDVARDSTDAYDELTDGVNKNRQAQVENKKAILGTWGARKEELAKLRETGEQQNYLVAASNSLGAAYESAFLALSKKLGLYQLYVKWGWIKVETTTAEAAAEATSAAATTADTAATTANTVATATNTKVGVISSLTTKAKLVLTKLQTIATGGLTIATNIQSAATWALNAASTALGATLTALYGSVLLPLVVTLGIIIGLGRGLAKVFGFLPSPLEKTRRSIKETREELDKLRESQEKTIIATDDYTEKQVKSVEAYRTAKRSIEAYNIAIKEGNGLLHSTAKQMEVFKKTPTEAAGQVQGLGTAIVRVLDFITVNATRLVGWLGNILGGLTKGIGELVSRLPGVKSVGNFFKDLGVTMEALDDVGIKLLREGFNNLNLALTQVNNATKEAIKLHQDLTDEVLRASHIGEGEMERGEAASEEGKRILKLAAARALSVEEMKTFQQEEQKFVENEKAIIQGRVANLDEEIKVLTDRLEKKGKLNQNDQAKLDALQQQRKEAITQITDLEEVHKKEIEYHQNLNAMMLALEENNASASIVSANKKVAQTYSTLPEAAKQAYAEILGLQITTIEENGQQVSVALQKDYDLFNRGQRQKYLAFTSAMADVANNVNNATDINSQETLGDLQDDIFNFAESAQEMLAAGFDPEAVLADFKGGLEAFRIQFKEKGMTDAQMDLLDAAGQEALMDLLFEMYEATSNKIINANKHQIEVLSLQNEMGVGDQITNLAKIQELNEANAQEAINLDKKKLADLKEAGLEYSVDYLRLQESIALQEMQLDKLVIDNKLGLLDKELDIFRDIQQNKTSILEVESQLNQENYIEDLEEINRLNEELARKEIETNRKKLAQLAAENLAGSEDYLKIQRELALQEISYNKLTLDNKVKVLEEQNKIVEKQYQNNIAQLKNIAEAEIQVLDLQQKRQEFNIRLAESRNAVVSAIEEYEISALENINKLETDITDKAENQLEIFIKRGEAQERAREFEVLSLENQQKANQLAILREKTTIRINRAEAQLAVIQAQNAIAQAKLQKVREEELQGLQLALEAAQLTLVGLDQQTEMLKEQEQFQQEMFDNEVKVLEAKHRAQEEAYSTDLVLQQNQAALAAYDEQIAKLQNMSQIQKITTDIQVQRREAENTLLEGQISILQQQQEFVNSSNQIQQDAYSLAINMAKSEYQRRRLEREAAEARLKNLRATQEAEERIFQLNQKQQRLALEMSVLKSDAASSQAQAELMVARAEAQKVMADVTASEEQKAAALASVAAAEATLQSAQMQQIITREQQNVFEETAQLKETQFQQQQKMAELQARGDLASKTTGWGDDIAIRREAQALARGRTAEQQQGYERQQALERERSKPTEEGTRRQRDLAEQQAATLGRTMGEQIQDLQSSQQDTLGVNFEQLVGNSNQQLLDMTNLLQTAVQIKDFLFRTGQNTLPITTPTLTMTSPNLSGMIDINLNLNVEGDTTKLDTEALNKQVSTVVYDGLYDLFEDMRRGLS